MVPGGFVLRERAVLEHSVPQEINTRVPDECAGRFPPPAKGITPSPVDSGNIFIGDPPVLRSPASAAVTGQRVGDQQFPRGGRTDHGEERPSRYTARRAAPPGSARWTSSPASSTSGSQILHDPSSHPPDDNLVIRHRANIHPQIAKIGIPGYSGDLVGPQLGVSLNIDGGPAQLAPAYLNIENDPIWVFTHRDRKVGAVQQIYARRSATVDFRIEGYTAAGAKVAAADEHHHALHRQCRSGLQHR